MKSRHMFTGCLTALALTGAVSIASASSHREAPAIGFDPAADNTDLWAWVNDGAHDKLTIVAAYNPLEEPSGGPNYNQFSDDVRYEIHIARGNQSLEEAVLYQVRFSSNNTPYVDVADLSKGVGGGKEFFSQLSGKQQTYQVKHFEHAVPTILANGVKVAPTNIGPNTNAVVYNTKAYDDAWIKSNFVNPFNVGGMKGKVFAGPA